LGVKALDLLFFEDLREKKIVKTWTTINKWIDTRGFPPGRILAGRRAWLESEVLAWIERQPCDKDPRGYKKGAR
jgi:predicted DNA-binding transcriptional regulator AlpA